MRRAVRRAQIAVGGNYVAIFVEEQLLGVGAALEAEELEVASDQLTSAAGNADFLLEFGLADGVERDGGGHAGHAKEKGGEIVGVESAKATGLLSLGVGFDEALSAIGATVEEKGEQVDDVTADYVQYAAAGRFLPQPVVIVARVQRRSLHAHLRHQRRPHVSALDQLSHLPKHFQLSHTVSY